MIIQDYIDNPDLLSKNMTLRCNGCQKDFAVSKRDITERIRVGSKDAYCNKQCYQDAIRVSRTTVNCVVCGKEVVRTTARLSKRPCCSVSCSSKLGAKAKEQAHTSKYGRPKKDYFCHTCGAQCKKGRKYCSDTCNPGRHEYKTIADLADLNNGKYNANSQLRGIARRIYLKSTDDHSCQCCGYTKFIDVCHIKSVASFDENTLVSVVNDLDNLIGLCPNCHKELDKIYDGNIELLFTNHQ